MRVLALAPVVALAVAAPGCGAAKQSSGLTAREITIPFVADMSAPDPDVFYDVEGSAVILSVYQGLVKYAPGTTIKIVPDLATAYTVSPDKKTYTFKLRPGVKFHDGSTMTSTDVKRSFLRRGALKQGSGYMVAGITSMDTPDPLTFVVHLKAPQLPFMDYLASQWGPRVIGPKALVDNAGSDHSQRYLSTHADGTGPYQLASFQRGTAYVLRAFAGFRGPKPYYTSVRLAITPSIQAQEVRLKGGDFAAMLNGYPTSNLDQARKDPALKVTEFPSQQTLIAYVNTHKRPFDDPAARAGIAKVIDLKTIVSQAYGDTAVVPVGPYPPAVLSRQPKLDYGQSAPGAAPSAGKGQTVRIAYPADEVAALSRVSQLLQIQLAKLGYDVKIEQVPHSQIYAYTKDVVHAPDIALLTNNPDAAHPDTWAGINWGKAGGVNILAYSDPVVEQGLKGALAQPDEAAADAIYRRVGQRIIDQHAMFFLANVKDTIVSRKGLGNVQHSPLYPRTIDLAALRPAP